MNLRCAASLCVLLAAAGCGQRGPLYLPGDPNEGRIVLPTEAPAGAADGEAAEPENPQEPQKPDDSEDDEQ